MKIKNDEIFERKFRDLYPEIFTNLEKGFEAIIKDISDVSSIRCPTLIISTKLDPIHPYEYGKCLASIIPRSVFFEAVPKSENLEKHLGESQAALSAFLQKLYREKTF